MLGCQSSSDHPPTCAPDEPDAGYLEGAQGGWELSFSEIQTTAVGGEQELRLRQGGPEGDLWPDPVEFVSATEVLEVVEVHSSDVTLFAHEPGTTAIRAVDPNTDEVLGCVDVSAARVANVGVEPMSRDTKGIDLSNGWVLADENPQFIYLEYRSDEGELLTTGSADVTLDGLPLEEAGPLGWNARVPSFSSTGPHVVSVATEGASFESELDVVEGADAIARVDESEPLEVDVGNILQVCFQALLERGSGPTPVLGPGWKFSGSTGNVHVHPKDGGYLFEHNCAEIEGLEAGEAVVRVETDDVTRDFTVMVQDGGGS